MRLEFLVRRAGIDTTAETTLHALRALMGIAVDAVEHGTLWRFEIAAEPEILRVKDAIARAACRAGRYVNLNRDVVAWLDDASVRARVAPGQFATDLWITDGDGTDPTAADYFARQLGKPFQQVRRGTLYRLWAEHEDAASARAAALQVAVTRTRRQGLLMNPHAQSVEVLRVWSHRPAEDA